MISVLILTFNESVNLPECLRSVNFSDDIVVLDSQSSDDTVKIAEDHGCTVLSRPFDDYASQRNFGLSFNFKYDWVLMIDADERVSKEAKDEIVQAVKNDNQITLYRIRRKDIFLGRWLKRSSGYPTWFGRLFRKGHVQVKRKINEEYNTDGQVGLLKSHLIHYPFNKGIHYWFERHNRYSTAEAFTLSQELKKKIAWKYFFSSDPQMRRKFLKSIAYRTPCRPVIVFLYLYFFRGGFLDGKAGFRYCAMRFVYEFMIDLKFTERSLNKE